MSSLPFFLLSREEQESERRCMENAWKEAEHHFEEYLVPNAVDWDPNVKYSDLNRYKEVCFKASTYSTVQKPLFDAEPVPLCRESKRAPVDGDVVGPVIEEDGKKQAWVYRHLVLPRGEVLTIFFGNARGTVCFDGDVYLPALYRWDNNGSLKLWMSRTPMEVFTQRSGIRHCSGVVCIGGYGLGWFLEQVAKKRSVKKIVIVEKSKELLQWFGYEHSKRVAEDTGTEIEVVHADAFAYLIEHHSSFDKIALDVFLSYGNNNVEDDYRIRDLLKKQHPKRRYMTVKRFDSKKLWCWGSVRIGRK